MWHIFLGLRKHITVISEVEYSWVDGASQNSYDYAKSSAEQNAWFSLSSLLRKTDSDGEAQSNSVATVMGRQLNHLSMYQG